MLGAPCTLMQKTKFSEKKETQVKEVLIILFKNSMFCLLNLKRIFSRKMIFLIKNVYVHKQQVRISEAHRLRNSKLFIDYVSGCDARISSPAGVFLPKYILTHGILKQTSKTI